jgi:hypothetical protein
MLLHVISEVNPNISVTQTFTLIEVQFLPEDVTIWRQLDLFLATQMMYINITKCWSLDIPKIVLLGLLATWNFAASPIILSVSLKATQLGIVLFPWSLRMISTLPFLNTPTHE